MTTEASSVKEILFALLDKIPDAPQQQQQATVNDHVNREIATNEEMARLSAEVKLLSEKFEQKCVIEKQQAKVLNEISCKLEKLLSRQESAPPKEASAMQKLEEFLKIRDNYMANQEKWATEQNPETFRIVDAEKQFWKQLYEKKFTELYREMFR